MRVYFQLVQVGEVDEQWVQVGAMSLAPGLEQFSAEHRAHGFDKVLKRHWPALIELTTHEHEFQAKALVVEGERWLSVEAQIHHLRAGSTFELDARLPHAERCGNESAI